MKCILRKADGKIIRVKDDFARECVRTQDFISVHKEAWKKQERAKEEK